MARFPASAGAAGVRFALGVHRDWGGHSALAFTAVLDPRHRPEPPAFRSVPCAHDCTLDRFDLALQRHAEESAVRAPLSRVAQHLAQYALHPRGRGGARAFYQHEHPLLRMGDHPGDPGSDTWTRRPAKRSKSFACRRGLTLSPASDGLIRTVDSPLDQPGYPVASGNANP